MTGLYIIKDVPAQVFGPPMVARTELVASRMYIRMLADNKLPQADYELYQIGIYDQDTGVAKVHDPVRITPTYKGDADLSEVAK